MSQRDLLMKLIEREQKYCDAQQVGTADYCDSFDRLLDLRKELAALEKTETDILIKEKEMKGVKSDRTVKNVIEGVKVGGGIVTSVGIAVGVMAMEKEGYTFTSLCKSVLNQLISKKS